LWTKNSPLSSSYLREMMMGGWWLKYYKKRLNASRILTKLRLQNSFTVPKNSVV
jgi:hypothetical protein